MIKHIKIRTMYTRAEYRYGDYREIKKYFAGHQRAGKRGKREKPTSEEMTRYNQKQRARKVQRLILANFRPGDWHLTLSYAPANRPGSIEEAEKAVKAFLRRIRRALQKEGRELRYIYVTERGKKGACHHHMILEDLPGMKRLILDNWKQGAISFVPLHEDGEYEKLAEYVVKKETKEENGKTYRRSKNLIVPEPKIEKVPAMSWKETPKPPKGWEIVSLENGVNIVTGLPYQRILMKKLDDRKRRRGSGRDPS